MYVRLGICLLCPKHSFCYFQEENQYETCFWYFHSDLLHCFFSGRQVCIFSLFSWVLFPMGAAPAHIPEKRMVMSLHRRIDFK